jgi:hypothetical protein
MVSALDENQEIYPPSKASSYVSFAEACTDESLP